MVGQGWLPTRPEPHPDRSVKAPSPHPGAQVQSSPADLGGWALAWGPHLWRTNRGRGRGLRQGLYEWHVGVADRQSPPGVQRAGPAPDP